ncbi:MULTISPECIES: SMP-30/gluconolactonase/LRE family protein [unclassified Streptomyces]|uniref:SMP-30/gluconolactonase/LRE family protein n=1 Tax=unclassified Streptomyces TaxID=2593676 RepID=UPI001BAFB98C|nr:MULTISPECIES: SMP-30/gluconolactonase/LRE family protein [unclassified Streptomyces]MDH6449863.1 sugar lactone lactonase YvrE [Streptomyces sp. SAI-119]MDH6499687.1 sugar lactone lactonase YvrE [Streptomyces sp. SAI-149]QUC61716.1 SMP-30/gluconolactonase/LRE family protein [Streptomyces sp. A2-16]
MTRITTYEVAVRAQAALGEGPTWDGERLLWIDILGARLHTYDPVSGHRTVRVLDQHIGAVKPRAGGGLVLNLRDGVALLDPDGSFRWLHHEPVPGRRANDAAVAPDGSLWAGTMRYDEAPGGGTLSRVTADGTHRTVLDDVAVSNGTGWSPDGRLMYYVDSPTRRVDVLDHENGQVSGRRTFVEIEDGAGFPDGLTVDADGCVWVALWDGAAVRRYTPDGELDRVITLPTPRVTACAFGGPDLTDLYITTARVGLDAPHPVAGSLLVVPGAGKGVQQPSFAG